MRRLSIPEGLLEWGAFSYSLLEAPRFDRGGRSGSGAAGPDDKIVTEDDKMSAIKKLKDITENDVKEAWSALRERKPLIFHTATNAPN